jgi:flagellar basal body rod protein FlgC
MGTIKVVDGVEEVTMQDLMEAYRELQAARENLTQVKEMLKAARERVAMAEVTLERLFIKLESAT